MSQTRERSLSPLEVTRALDDATQQDELGRFYRLDHNKERAFGYHSWMSGAWVCYTCGHLCECSE